MTDGDNARRRWATPTNFSILWLYHLYRLTISLALLEFTANEDKLELLGIPNKAFYQYLSWSYLPLTLILAIVVRRPENHRTVFGMALFDIATLLVLFHAAAGTHNSIGTFIVISVAIANTLLPRQLGLLLAATASLGMFAISLYLNLGLGATNAVYVEASVLGGLCLALATMVQRVSFRLRASETLAQERAEDLAGLQALNAMIIERMLPGLLVLDDRLRIILSNQTGRTALGVKRPERQAISQLFPALFDCLQEWQHNPLLRHRSLTAPAGRLSLNPTFITLGKPARKRTLVFLEDAALITQQAQQMKLASLGRLAASIAHEIRNPLASISHAAQLLQESETLDPASRRLGIIIQEQSKRMDHIIEDVLQLSRRRPAAPALLDLGTWLQHYVKAFHETADSKHRLHLLGSEEPFLTLIDGEHLAQVLGNLINNGMRHSIQKNGLGQVWLQLQRNDQTQQPMLDVIDDGPGVSGKQLRYLFEPFHTTEIGGTGLGLYISKELCEANQAHLEYLKLRQDGGGCFRIIFALP